MAAPSAPSFAILKAAASLPVTPAGRKRSRSTLFSKCRKQERSTQISQRCVPYLHCIQDLQSPYLGEKNSAAVHALYRESIQDWGSDYLIPLPPATFPCHGSSANAAPTPGMQVESSNLLLLERREHLLCWQPEGGQRMATPGARMDHTAGLLILHRSTARWQCRRRWPAPAAACGPANNPNF